MLLDIKDVKQKFAIGLKWAVDTRAGIEEIQQNTGYVCGFIKESKLKLGRKYKIFALATEDHKDAISLSGAASRKYTNAIIIHKLNELTYWLCIIKSGEVWSGEDVPKGTAGDCIADLASAQRMIEAAELDFKSVGDEVVVERICTETAVDDFPEWTQIDFMSLVLEFKKLRRGVTIKYLQPHIVVLQRLIIAIVTVVLLISVSLFFYDKYASYHKTFLAEQARQQQLLLQAKQKEAYLHNLQAHLQQEWGYKVVGDLMARLGSLPAQSEGWELTSFTYDVSSPKAITLNLKRTQYGTVDSFDRAYLSASSKSMLEANNNAGTKLFTFANIKTIEPYSDVISHEQLVSKVHSQRQALLSVLQVQGSRLKLKTTVDKAKKGRYGIYETEVSLSGGELWQLYVVQQLLKNFHGFTIDRMKFTVKDFNMKWQIEGKVYG